MQAAAQPSVRVFLPSDVPIEDFGIKKGTCKKGDKTDLVRDTNNARNTVKETTMRRSSRSPTT